MTLLSANQIAYIFRANDKRFYYYVVPLSYKYVILAALETWIV